MSLSISVLQVAVAGISIVIFSLVWKIIIKRLVLRSSLDNIPGPPSPSFVAGNVRQLIARDSWAFHEHLSLTYGNVVKTHGPLGEKRLLVSDPKALHYLVVKEQEYYQPVFRETVRLLFGDGLITSLGHRHREQRKMLTPAFSAAAMRDLYPVFVKVASQLRSAVAVRVSSGAKEVDILHWMSRTALELIGQGGLGHSFDPLVEDSYIGSYAQSLKNLGPALSPFALWTESVEFLVRFGSPQFRRKLVDSLPWKGLHNVRNIVDSIEKTSVDILDDKRRAIDGDEKVRLEQVGDGKDIMSILLRANLQDKRLSDNEVIGQMALLTVAASDTTSSAISRILHLLSKSPNVQDRLRQELADARANNGGEDIGYDALVGLPLLDAICRETLRLFPPVALIRRIATQDTILPLSQPLCGVDGTLMNEIHVPKGTHILIGILAANRDASIWGPDALEWKPERWLSRLPPSVVQARLPGVYSNSMTFSSGSRACIGFKFSQLEMKVVLSLLIESFSFALPKQEISWNMSGIAFPSIDGVKGLPCMPLLVTPL